MAKTLLGLTLCQGTRFDDGIQLIHDAIRIADRAFSHFSLGEALAARGRLSEAVPAFRRSIALEPGILAAHTALGRALVGLGEHAAAAAAFRDAVLLDPTNPEPYVGTAMLLHQLGRPQDALAQVQVALDLAPERADAWTTLGTVLLALGQTDDAVAAERRAIELDPGSAAAHLYLGDGLHAQRDLVAALACYQRAIDLSPSLADAHCHMSNTLYELTRFEEAAAAAAAAIALRPNYPEAHCNLGNALQPLLRYEDAEACYRTAVSLRPDSAAHHSNLSVVLTAQGRLEEALAAQRRALELDPGFIDARYNHAITLLLDGQYSAGWRQYETRWHLSWSPPRGFQQPQWAGETLCGQTILLHPEQGLGDTLQMVRYAPLVAARGGRVVLEVQAPLVRLMAGLPGVQQVIPLGGELPPFDWHCPLFSLPLAFGTSLHTIPAEPYLVAPPDLAAQWAARLGRRTGLRVGLVWGGAEKIGWHVNRQRSVALDQLAPLATIPGVNLYSLQKDPDAAAIHIAAKLGIVDLMADVVDFADTAALVAQLDLVISVDTSTAHLAAAMGKPVWLLSRHNGCWRWLTNRHDSPWYPSLRIYRQERPGDWAPAIGRVAADLAARSRG
jgi:tetratricopeptide (TPR) repeat protein